MFYKNKGKAVLPHNKTAGGKRRFKMQNDQSNDQPSCYMIRGKMMSCFRYLIQGTPILYIIKNKLSSVFYKKN